MSNNFPLDCCGCSQVVNIKQKNIAKTIDFFNNLFCKDIVWNPPHFGTFDFFIFMSVLIMLNFFCDALLL